ncbi:MAG: KpsF/GutQ family sugar-phosphate isomerase [Bdellovibrionales bacterium]
MQNDDIDNAKNVISIAAQGLHALEAAIDANLANAVETIHTLKTATPPGRLIVAGIGKSGHVARKIAATMASTGTPAYFVHPGEASHGDMGMITQNDAVLMLSNSGENAELSDLIHYTRRYAIPLIAMTGKPQSTLATHADTVLLLPNVPEACPNGLAPTTSTTMMIALGDALAVALLHRMGLTPEQYKVFHPGGKLGQKLMKVTELMVPIADMPLARTGTKMSDALLIMTEKNLGAIIIINDQKDVQGIITDGDLKRHMGPDLLEKTVDHIMSANPKTIDRKALAVEALNAMTKDHGKYLSSLLVMDGQTLIGMIRMQDCLQAGLN